MKNSERATKFEDTTESFFPEYTRWLIASEWATSTQLGVREVIDAHNLNEIRIIHSVIKHCITGTPNYVVKDD